METRITYKGTLNGIKGIWCGFKPEEAVIEQEFNILYPAEKKLLRKKGEEQTYHSVVLLDGDSMDNYKEVEDDNSK